MSIFENILIRHCAPTLLGVKQANLFSCPAKNEEEFYKELDKYNSLLNAKDIYFKILYTCKNKFFIIAYRKKAMINSLNNHAVRYTLRSIGYPIADAEKALDEIFNYLSQRITGCDDFPHEIGFFLGYPLDDVLNFIKHKGKNYKFCGYWKVYSNEEEAKKLFAEYKNCSEKLLSQANRGIPVLKILGAV